MESVIEKNESHDRVVFAKGLRWRLRFSLQTLIAVVLCISAGIVTFLSQNETRALRAENRKLRDALGALDIRDRSTAYLISPRNLEEWTWRWRYWLPASGSFKVCATMDGIPAQGFPDHALKAHHLYSGENSIDAAIRRDYTGKWVLLLSASGITEQIELSGGLQAIVATQAGETRLSPNAKWYSPSLAADHTTGHDPAQPIELLRIRVGDKIDGNGLPADDQGKPLSGLMIWIVPEQQQLGNEHC